MDSESLLNLPEWIFVDKVDPGIHDLDHYLLGTYNELRSYNLLFDPKNEQIDGSSTPSQCEKLLLDYIDSDSVQLQSSLPQRIPKSNVNSNPGSSDPHSSRVLACPSLEEMKTSARTKQKCSGTDFFTKRCLNDNSRINATGKGPNLAPNVSKNHNIMTVQPVLEAPFSSKSKKRSSNTNDDVARKNRFLKKAKLSTTPESTTCFTNAGYNFVKKEFPYSVKDGFNMIRKESKASVDQPQSTDTVLAGKFASSSKSLARTRTKSSGSASSSTVTLDLSLKFRRDSKKNPLTEAERRLKIAIRAEKNREAARRSVQKKKEKEMRLYQEYDRMRTNLHSLVQDKNKILEKSFGVLKNLVAHFLGQNDDIKIAAKTFHETKVHSDEVAISTPEQLLPKLQVYAIREPLDFVRQDPSLDGVQAPKDLIVQDLQLDGFQTLKDPNLNVRDPFQLDPLHCGKIIDAALCRGESGNNKNQPESEPEFEAEIERMSGWNIFEEDVTMAFESPI